MADIYLGLTQSGAVLLPKIRWTGGGNPTIGTNYPKQVERVGTLGGTQRFNFKSHHPAHWTLSWEMLTAAELAVLKALKAYNQELWFQNNWEDATWHLVAITDFNPEPFLKAGSTACRYSLSMTLEEVQ
jgi:hypothetical protein